MIELRWRMSFIALVLFFLSLPEHSNSESIHESKRDVDYGIVLCYENDQLKGDWDTNILIALGRALSPSMAEKKIRIRKESCAIRMPDTACYGTSHVIACRAEALERILKASGWMT